MPAWKRWMAKRHHNYYFQVQQQLFTLTDRKYCDFVVCAISPDRKPHIVKERIYPDLRHWNTAVPKLEAFWRIYILPEILGRWYTRRCTLPVSKPIDNGICFCRAPRDETVITCSNTECPYAGFHPSCLALSSAMIPKTWYCPHCSKLPQFKRKRGRSSSTNQHAQKAVINQAALQCNIICVCASKPSPTDKLVECDDPDCKTGKFFHLTCLGLKRLPNNSKTTWQCCACKKRKKPVRATTCTSFVSVPTPSIIESSSDREDDVSVIKGTVNKKSALSKLVENDYQTILSPDGWLTCHIIQ